MNIILSCPSETIYNIRDYSGIPTYIKRRLPNRVNTLIRWGSTRSCEADKTYNSIESIQLASNKPRCRKVLAQNSIPVPQMGEDKFPCIGRTKYHTGGKGFWICRSSYEVAQAKREGAQYFSQFYPKENEYRVHIGSGKVILYSEKIGDKLGGMIWNHDIGGFEFQHLGRGERRQCIIDLAKSAVKAIGLDFGAVDILADAEDDDLPEAVVCEINTAPRLEIYGTRKYSEYFNSLLEDE